MRLAKLTAALAIVGIGFLSFFIESNEVPVGFNIGDRAPEIKSTLLSGNQFSTAELRGKMVLIDFWASYDASSRISNQVKSELYEKYQNNQFLKGQGFTIVSISLDRFKNPLKKAIDTDLLTYPYHICDYMGKDSELVKQFNGSGFRKILLDGDGRIVAVSHQMEDISNTLARLSIQ